MANQRLKGKQLVTFWLTPKERKQLRAAAANAGMTVSDFIIRKCKIVRDEDAPKKKKRDD